MRTLSLSLIFAKVRYHHCRHPLPPLLVWAADCQSTPLEINLGRTAVSWYGGSSTRTVGCVSVWIRSSCTYGTSLPLPALDRCGEGRQAVVFMWPSTWTEGEPWRPSVPGEASFPHSQFSVLAHPPQAQQAGPSPLKVNNGRISPP